MIRKDQLKCDTKTSASHEACCKLLGATAQVTYRNGATADCIGSILTLPKFYLATLKLQLVRLNYSVLVFADSDLNLLSMYAYL